MLIPTECITDDNQDNKKGVARDSKLYPTTN